MNEIEIIRSQLTAEQSHAAEIANACAVVFGASAGPAMADEAAALLREACVSYLVWVLTRFEERDQTLSELLAARESASAAGAAAAAQLGALLSRPGRSREALAHLESTLASAEADGARSRWQEFARFFNSVWASRRSALERALVEHLSVADWRAVGAIDADSILDERRRYARVVAELPAGMELPRR
ncbi:MAG TPA: hypothetical protein VMD06_05060 [Steroidobacteraceae bacterium]|nr:hypothetical protein [Steroidobacteraceae bacterium]